MLGQDGRRWCHRHAPDDATAQRGRVSDSQVCGEVQTVKRIRKKRRKDVGAASGAASDAASDEVTEDEEEEEQEEEEQEEEEQEEEEKEQEEEHGMRPKRNAQRQILNIEHLGAISPVPDGSNVGQVRLTQRLAPPPAKRLASPPANGKRKAASMEDVVDAFKRHGACDVIECNALIEARLKGLPCVVARERGYGIRQVFHAGYSAEEASNAGFSAFEVADSYGGPSELAPALASSPVPFRGPGPAPVARGPAPAPVARAPAPAPVPARAPAPAPVARAPAPAGDNGDALDRVQRLAGLMAKARAVCQEKKNELTGIRAQIAQLNADEEKAVADLDQASNEYKKLAAHLVQASEQVQEVYE